MTSPQLLTVEEVARMYGKKPSYVYRMASLHGWRRIRLDGRVYYDTADVDRVFGKD